MTLGEKIQALEAFRDTFRSKVDEILTERTEDILDMQKEQLFSGKASDGNDLRPYYSEDLKSRGGFFKSPESARRYAEHKAAMSYPSKTAGTRNPDAPNLYITGEFHKQLRLDITDQYIAVTGSTPWSQGIMQHYGLDNFGLTEENLSVLREEYIRDTLIEALRNSL